MIPYKLFLLYLGELDHMEGISELREARSVALGIGLAWDGKNNKIRNAVRGLIRRAFPEIYERTKKE